jgi:murein L,D-transpeptidase YcbB/YkuD
MIRKSAVLVRAGMLPAAAALALMGHIAARAEISPQAAPQRALESELEAMKLAATDTPKDQTSTKTPKADEPKAPAQAPATTATTTPADAAKAAPAATPVTTPAVAPTTAPAPATAPADATKKDAAVTPAAPTPAATTPAATTPAAAAPAAAPNTPGATAALPEAVPGATPPTAPPAVTPAPPADPIIAVVRQRIPEAAKGANPDDVKALIAYYGELVGPPIWVSSAGFTPKAKAATAELAKADDWGLNATDFKVPQVGAALTPEAAADAEIKTAAALLKYARYARGGRVNPMAISQLIDQVPPVRDPKVVLADLAATDAPDAYLRGLQPKHEQFELLRQALLKARGGTLKEEAPPAETPQDPALAIQIPPGRIIVPGGKDSQVALLRQRLKVPADDPANETVYDAKLQDAVKDFQKGNNLRADGQIGNGTRNALNAAGKPKQASAPPPPATNEAKIDRILINMERWRWLPEQLGKFYVWDNVPEALTRIIKDGKVIHTARIIVGQPTWPTPTFSADMKTIVFHPTWGVPEGIKAKELAPILRKSAGGGLFGFFGGGYSANAVLEAYQLRAYINGRPVDGNSVDWSSVDMRSVSFQQPPGPKNPLGEVKFLFPNKHDVYMHDTPERNLFPKTFRAFSHGCMRVQDPSRFAEIILAEDKGWPAEKTRSMFGGGSQDVPLDTHIPVHVTYMTARVTDDGKLETYGDFYGLDSRVAAALTGKSVRFEQPAYPQDDVVASDDDSPLTASTPGQRKGKKKQQQSPASLSDAISGIFSP